MDLQHALQQCLPLVSSQSAAEVDAEVREELEFHLAMRTEDNLRSGMTLDEARRDARQRFGDFEASRRECRQIAMGPRLLFGRLQTGLLVTSIAVVVYLGLLLFNLQTTSRDQIEALTRTVEQLQAARRSIRDESATIPYAQWNLHLGHTATASDAPPEVAGWNQTDDSLRQPWSDWPSFDGPAGVFD